MSDIKIQFESNLPKKPLVSLVLLDWSCRESLHMLDYLAEQTIDREKYEIIWIEYYTKVSPELKEKIAKYEKEGKAPPIDKWIIMNMPEDLYYHKHLMYNVGIALSKGEVITICDSDAMVKPSFIETIVKEFEEDPHLVLHMDEVRNNDKKFHPFNYPDFEVVEGPGAINFTNGTTTGLVDEVDPLHTLNYGACMCAKRSDIIAIGGADEHINFLGHVCGPYDITFRLANYGKREYWHPSELLYHVWHPGQAGDGNFVGPHDGKHMSSTALEAKDLGRIKPLLENEAIKSLRIHGDISEDQIMDCLVDPFYLEEWTEEALAKSSSLYLWYIAEVLQELDGYNVVRHAKKYYGLPCSLDAVDLNKEEDKNHPALLRGESEEEILALIKEAGPSYKSEFLEDYCGYNLVKHGPLVYVIPHGLGSVDLNDKEQRKHPNIHTGENLEEAKRQVDIIGPFKTVELVCECGQYNILKWGDMYFGVPFTHGAIDLNNSEERERPDILKSESIDSIKETIREVSAPMMIGAYGNFNIVQFGIDWYAVPHWLGSLDLLNEQDRSLLGIIHANSLEKLQEVIDLNGGFYEGSIVSVYRGFNLIPMNGRLYGIPQVLGAVDLRSKEELVNREIICADNKKELENAVDSMGFWKRNMLGYRMKKKLGLSAT